MAKKHGAKAHGKAAMAKRTFGHGRKPPHGQATPDPMEGGGGPMPGPNEFTGDQEAAMRGGMRSARGAPPTDGSDAPEPDMDDGSPGQSGPGLIGGQ